MRKFQVLRRPVKGRAPEPRKWEFVAHGALYDGTEVAAMRAVAKERGFQYHVFAVDVP